MNFSEVNFLGKKKPVWEPPMTGFEIQNSHFEFHFFPRFCQEGKKWNTEKAV